MEGAPASYQYTGGARGSHCTTDDISLPIASWWCARLGQAEGRPAMNRSLYGERDYAFGQRILTLRTQLGLTEAGRAEPLHVSRRAVTEWEAGSSYPKAEHLKHLIALGVQQQAFPAGREAEEIRALWHAAHQKLLLDEAWLAALLGRPRPALTLLHPVPLETPRPGELPAAEPVPGRHRQVGTGSEHDARAGSPLQGGHLAPPARCPCR